MSKSLTSVLLLLCLAGCSSVSTSTGNTNPELVTGAPENVAKFYVELKNWPEDKFGQFLSETANIMDGNKCLSVSPAALDCHTFAWFKNIESIRSVQISPANNHSPPVARKMTLTYYDEKSNQIQVEIFEWDGVKLNRIRNSKTKPMGSDFSEFIILWSFK